MPKLLKWFKDVRYWIFYGLFLNRNFTVISMGNRSTGCSWNFNMEGLNSNSIVYSGGVGRDITFEHALLQRFGCSIVLVDPSPTGTETMSKKENQIQLFKFYPIGLADECKMLKLSSPINETEGSWSAFSDKQAVLEVPAQDLETLMKKNGHNHIDLLKLDIEGAEYEVMDNFLEKQIPIRQVLVEFHHGILPGIRRGQTIRLILKMIQAGYKLLDQDGNNHTFYMPALQFEAKIRKFKTHTLLASG